MHLAFKTCGFINSVTQPFPDFYVNHVTVKTFSLNVWLGGRNNGLKVKSTLCSCEDLCQFLNHIVAHNHLNLVSRGLMLSSELCRHQVYK